MPHPFAALLRKGGHNAADTKRFWHRPSKNSPTPAASRLNPNSHFEESPARAGTVVTAFLRDFITTVTEAGGATCSRIPALGKLCER